MRYPLIESESAIYAERTRRNVDDGDGTLVLTYGEAEGGTALTIDFAAKLGRPCLVLDLAARPVANDALNWASANAVRRLNVAGPRASTAPAARALADVFMTSLLVADAED